MPPVPVTPPGLRERWGPLVVGIVAATAIGVALAGAVRSYGRPVASVLVDPDACVSGIGSPSWEGLQQGLRFPDRVTSIDGVDLTVRTGAPAARGFDRAIDAAVAAGRTSVHVRVETSSGPRELDLPLVPLGALTWWTLAAGMFLAGGLYVVAALTAMRASPRGPLARTFAKTALLCAAFMVTFFDAHTTRWLVLLSQAAFAMLPGAFIALALRLPDDAPLVRRHPWLVRALDSVGFVLAAAMIGLGITGRSTADLRSACSVMLGASQLVFVVTFLVRFAIARGERRVILRALLAAVALPHALVGAGIILALVSAGAAAATSVISVSIPILSLLPISAVVAFLRHDLWGSQALVSRVATMTVAGGLAFVLSSALGAAIVATFDVPFSHAVLGSTSGALAAAGIVTLVLRMSDRRFFRARAEYKPAIEGLSEHLKSLVDPTGVTDAVERVVRRSLQCDEGALLLAEDADDRGAEGQRPPAAHTLAVPIVLGDKHLGVLEARRAKRTDALFTSDDRDLLRTIANQAALALAYTRSYRELELRRRRQVEAWREEREVLLETVSAEIAHEVRYPINFFRSVFGRGDPALDAEEIEIGREEVDRLERLVAGLRRLEHRRLDRQAAVLVDVIGRAELLLRDALGERQLDVDVPPGVMIRADLDQVTQVLVNLLSNALEAAGAAGRVGVEWRTEGTSGLIVVWDTGPGFEGQPSALFAPWFTTKPKGTGLGLAISHRIVRAHGWSIDARRAENRTEFTIAIPSSDIPPRLDPTVRTSRSAPR